MIQDLIDVYYYIKSVDDLQDLEGWAFTAATSSHAITIVPTWNATYTDRKWEIKITTGNINDYRWIFLTKNQVEVFHYWKYRYAISIPGLITENESDMLMKFISTNEISIINQILLEMRKLENRSVPYERTKS